MENIETNTRRESPKNSIPILEADPNYYASASVTNPASDAFAFFQDSSNISRVLEDLPKGIKNFLDLSLTSAEELGSDEYKIVWHNSPKLSAGDITFFIKASPLRGGSIISSQANLVGIKFNHEGPSTLINLFI
jgi:hypothetical protein